MKLPIILPPIAIVKNVFNPVATQIADQQKYQSLFCAPSKCTLKKNDNHQSTQQVKCSSGQFQTGGSNWIPSKPKFTRKQNNKFKPKTQFHHFDLLYQRYRYLREPGVARTVLKKSFINNILGYTTRCEFQVGMFDFCRSCRYVRIQGFDFMGQQSIFDRLQGFSFKVQKSRFSISKIMV